MFSPWQMEEGRRWPMPAMQPMPMQPMPMQPMHLMMIMRPMQMRPRLPLRMMPGGAFPVPEAIKPDQFPPAVCASMNRICEGPPKPSVTPEIMNQTQLSMIAPDLPNKADV